LCVPKRGKEPFRFRTAKECPFCVTVPFPTFPHITQSITTMKATLLVGLTAAVGLTVLEAESKNYPAARVVAMLRDMKEQLEKENEEDKDIYEKMQCWCTTNDKEKSQAIKDAEERIDQLNSTIEELSGKAARLDTEITNLKEELASNQQALAEATKMREKQLAEFTQAERDMLDAIDKLKQAVEVLSKHNTTGFLQESYLVSLASMIHSIVDHHADIIGETITPSQRRVLQGFLQAPAYKSYNSRSGEIFGILRDMQQTFEKNLSESQKEELRRQKAFEDLRKAKEEEIARGQEQIATKTEELANTNADIATANDDLEDTKNTLSADEQYLMTLKEKCALTDKEWEQRSQTRADEMMAVSKAIEVLNGEEARDTFSNTYNTSFLQLSNEQKRAAEVLLAVHSPRLSILAAHVKLDAFTKVKKAIDDMVADLLKEKNDEIKHKDWCVAALNENENITNERTRNKQDTETLIDQLAARISAINDSVNENNKAIQEELVSIKHAGEDREKQNSEFQRTVEDQSATQQLLSKALDTLKQFYEKEEQAKTASFLQDDGEGKEEDPELAGADAPEEKKQPAGAPPPKSFKPYKKNAQGNAVLNLLNQLIEEAQAMEKQAIKDESDSQQSYEDLIKESNSVVRARRKANRDLQEEKAETEIAKSNAEDKHDGLVTELEQLAAERVSQKKACDFTLKNFDVRQKGRDEEIAALRQAKAILSGSKFQELLQTA